MPERRRWTVRDLRRDNRSVLLWSLYFDQPCSRQDLSEATGLSSASVSNVIRELIAEGIVIEAGSVDSDGGRPGRCCGSTPTTATSSASTWARPGSEPSCST